MVFGVFLDYAAAFCPGDFLENIFAHVFRAVFAVDVYCLSTHVFFSSLMDRVLATKEALRLTKSSIFVGADAVSHLQPPKTALFEPPNPNSKSNSASFMMSSNSSLLSNSKVTSPVKSRWRLGKYLVMLPLELRITGTCFRLLSMVNFQSVTRSRMVAPF